MNDRKTIINVELEWICKETLVTISGYYRVIRPEVMRKTSKSIRIFSIVPEIRTEHLVNEAQKLRRFSQLAR
jgi:hypothetical protein